MLLFTNLACTGPCCLTPFSNSTSDFLFLPLCLITSLLHNFSDIIFDDFSSVLLSHFLILSPTDVLVHQWLIKLWSSALIHLSFSPIIRSSLLTLIPISLTSAPILQTRLSSSTRISLDLFYFSHPLSLSFSNLADSWANVNSPTFLLLIPTHTQSCCLKQLGVSDSSLPVTTQGALSLLIQNCCTFTLVHHLLILHGYWVLKQHMVIVSPLEINHAFRP